MCLYILSIVSIYPKYIPNIFSFQNLLVSIFCEHNFDNIQIWLLKGSNAFINIIIAYYDSKSSYTYKTNLCLRNLLRLFSTFKECMLTTYNF